ncbi:hypothetical protein VZT92_011647 [Zoarces viviparus]|uniref:Uncharacterized protein n=1 Tax=Zoarces viviparus TaxID=48416 RepID=A0AAW1F5G7_ZOAVI
MTLFFTGYRCAAGTAFPECLLLKLRTAGGLSHGLTSPYALQPLATSPVHCRGREQLANRRDGDKRKHGDDAQHKTSCGAK